MKGTNIGIVKSIISQKMSNDYITEGTVNRSRIEANEFLKIVKNSPVLQLENKVFDRLENKTISSDIAATRYIDNNLSLFEDINKFQLKVEHRKIKKFLNENVAIDAEKAELYEGIGNLIMETLEVNDPDVDLIHESFTIVLNHIKKDKVVPEEKTVSPVIIPEGIDPDTLIETALNKFHEKYSSLNESDIELIKKVVISKDSEKKDIFEALRKENISILEGTDKNGIEDKIHKTIDQINKMEYTNESSIKKIISLHELKKNLL